jgi:hypothetical protein
MLFNPFPSFEAVTADAKDMWQWLTKSKDLDLCALSYSYPKGDKRLGVPPRRDVEDDSWANWYILSQALDLKSAFSGKMSTTISVCIHIFFAAVLVAFIISIQPASLLCAIYIALLGCLVMFLLGLRRLVTLRKQKRAFFSVLHILLDVAAVVVVLAFLIFKPLPIISAFGIVDYVVGIILILFFLRWIRDTIFLIFGPRLRHSPKTLVAMIHYTEYCTLQAQIYFVAAFFVVALQLLLGYVLSLFPKLHCTLLYNPHLTTKTHGLDNIQKGIVRKIENAPPAPGENLKA